MNELGERCQVDEYDGGGKGLPQRWIEKEPKSKRE